MSAESVMVSPERGTSRVLYRRVDAEAPPGDWDAGWPSAAIPNSVRLNAAGCCVFDGNWAVPRGKSGRAAPRSPQA